MLSHAPSQLGQVKSVLVATGAGPVYDAGAQPGLGPLDRERGQRLGTVGRGKSYPHCGQLTAYPCSVDGASSDSFRWSSSRSPTTGTPPHRLPSTR